MDMLEAIRALGLTLILVCLVIGWMGVALAVTSLAILIKRLIFR